MPLLSSATECHTAVEEDNSCFLLAATNNDLLVSDEDGETPLHYAATNNNIKICELLVSKCEFLLDIRDKDGKTALDWARSRDCYEVIAFLESVVVS
jgi:ankyrin repeat protein